MHLALSFLPMTEPLNDPVLWMAADLLDRYGFEQGAFSAEQLVGYWLRSYPAEWIRSAILEALYQGRYKSVSVGQILAIWKRRGQPLYHYSFEFERMVCGTLARIPTMEQPSAHVQTLPAKPSAESRPATTTDQAPPSHGHEAIAPLEGNATPPTSITPVDLGIESLSEAIAHTDRGSSGGGFQPAEPSSTDAIAEPATLEGEGSSVLEEAIAHAPSPAIDATPSDEEFAFLALSSQWTQQDLVRPPIHQFIPENEGSLFYEKLRAVAHEHLN